LSTYEKAKRPDKKSNNDNCSGYKVSELFKPQPQANFNHAETEHVGRNKYDLSEISIAPTSSAKTGMRVLMGKLGGSSDGETLDSKTRTKTENKLCPTFVEVPSFSPKPVKVSPFLSISINAESAPLQGKGLRNIATAIKDNPYSGTPLGISGNLAKSIRDSFGIDANKLSLRESLEVSKMGARATAQGNVIRFAPGQFNPGTYEGLSVLGHELSHVRDQAVGGVRANVAGTNIHYDKGHEARSDRTGEAFAKGTLSGAEAVSLRSVEGMAVQCDDLDGPESPSKESDVPSSLQASTEETKDVSSPQQKADQNVPIELLSDDDLANLDIESFKVKQRREYFKEIYIRLHKDESATLLKQALQDKMKKEDAMRMVYNVGVAGQYGGNQGSPERRFMDTRNTDFRTYMRNVLPGKSDSDIITYLQTFNTVGCGYVAMANTIFVEYANKPDEFREKFGFQMYTCSSRGIVKFTFDYLVINLYNGSGNIGNGTIPSERKSMLEGYLSRKGVKGQVTGGHSIDATSCIQVIREALKRGQVILRQNPTILYKLDGSPRTHAEGGHAVVVIRVEGGNLIVSSWGEQLMVKPSDYSNAERTRRANMGLIWTFLEYQVVAFK